MRKLRYGLIGAGNFGNFCIEHFSKSGLIEVAGVADMTFDLAKHTAQKFGVRAFDGPDSLLARNDIDIVHLATPPFTHSALALAAIAAGKHVLCEKPLATNLADARRMLHAASAARKVLVVNLIMRNDPLNIAVREILDQKLLGEPIAVLLTNLAGDYKLAETHWFWDRQKSGGIFIEHGVHFFDLFSMWFGDQSILSAVELKRPEQPLIVDQVQCVTRHANHVLATHYHGFHQPGALDRQEVRIICEKGDIRLFEWLSTHASIDALLDESSARKLVALLPGTPRVTSTPPPPPQGNDVVGRHKRFHADARYRIDADVGLDKLDLYGKVIRELLEDQVRFILDPQHVRRVTEEQGLSSLMVAEEAARLAKPSSD